MAKRRHCGDYSQEHYVWIEEEDRTALVCPLCNWVSKPKPGITYFVKQMIREYPGKSVAEVNRTAINVF